MRSIAFAQKNLRDGQLETLKESEQGVVNDLEKSGLTLVCIVGVNMNDLKPEAPEAVATL